jgi:hypothetical protein
MDLTTIFFDIDNFCQAFATHESLRLARPGSRRVREPELSISEVMTIVVWFHQSSYRTFKRFYADEILDKLRRAFPKAPSYNRFVELSERAMLPLSLFLRTRYGRCTGISFIDSTTIDVCQNQRIGQHKVFKSVAKRGKTSTGWFYGFKAHLTVNECGELLGVRFTPGDIDDRERSVIDAVSKNLWGKLVGDKGYISHDLFEHLYKRGVQMITKIKKNMKNKLMPLRGKLLLRKRALIECVNDALKNQCQIEHSRHRSVVAGFLNMIAALVMYTYLPKKPTLRFDEFERNALLQLQLTT